MEKIISIACGASGYTDSDGEVDVDHIVYGLDNFGKLYRLREKEKKWEKIEVASVSTSYPPN